VRVRWTDQARGDLLEIFARVAIDNPTAARALVARIRASVSRLRDHPRMGRALPELEDAGNVRQRVAPPYRIVYQIRRDDVIVLAVVHARRALHVAPEPEGSEE
jgi:addiction module RelE/StbE family toxin